MDSRRFDRTAKGHSEISQGNKSLKGKLRTVLFLIDAGKTADDLQRQILLIGAPADSIAQLVTGGYVAEVGKAGAPPTDGAGPTQDRVANFRVAKAFMNETIVDALGIRAGFPRFRVVHEDAAGHAPILERIWSSKEKSTGRSASPRARYHSQVWASPACSV